MRLSVQPKYYFYTTSNVVLVHTKYSKYPLQANDAKEFRIFFYLAFYNTGKKNTEIFENGVFLSKTHREFSVPHAF